MNNLLSHENAHIESAVRVHGALSESQEKWLDPARSNTISDTYKIQRLYFRGGRRTIATGLTLEEAQAHCRDPETSSSTCCKSVNKKRTKKRGPWFDSYDRGVTRIFE